MMLRNGFTINECYKCVYIKNTNNDFVNICLYVDHILILISNSVIINKIKTMLNRNFDVILRIKILRTNEGIFLKCSRNSTHLIVSKQRLLWSSTCIWARLWVSLLLKKSVEWSLEVWIYQRLYSTVSCLSGEQFEPIYEQPNQETLEISV